MLVKWRRFRQRLRDMRTLKDLSFAAEDIAAKRSELPPGAEHFLLAALTLPDGTARRAFIHANADADEITAAIDRQYDEALRSIGIEPPDVQCATEVPDDSEVPKPKLYQAKPSVTTLYKTMEAHTKANPDAPLLGATVVIGVASLEQGVAARALRAMNVDRSKLVKAAQDLIDQWQQIRAESRTS